MSPLSKKSFTKLFNSKILRSNPTPSGSTDSNKSTSTTKGKKQKKTAATPGLALNGIDPDDSDGLWDPFESSDDDSDEKFISALQQAREKYNKKNGIDESNTAPYGYSEWKKTRREWAGIHTIAADGQDDSDDDSFNSLLRDLDQEDKLSSPADYKESQLAAQRAHFVSTLKNVPETSYPNIYKMLVKDNRPLKKPMPLADALVVMKAGWIATGQWPPPSEIEC